jgi:eukaryotic-like serine/threonine-protein kinase
MAGNPFTYGNPISDPRRFFGRTLEVDQICHRLGDPEFESSSLAGDRRIGKTSLLNYLADPETRAAQGLDSHAYIFVNVDFQATDTTVRPDQLWRRLLTLMKRHCADPGIGELITGMDPSEPLDTFALDDFFQQVDDMGKYVVFLLDEFEHITTNPNFGPDFYYGLRSLVIHHRIALVTASRLKLVELTLSNAIKSSPFFNIFATINLRLFSAEESQHMISQSLSGMPVQFSEAEVAQVLDLAGPHPYFLQAACWWLYDSYQQGLDQQARSDRMRAQFRQEAIPHLIEYWDNSDDYEKIVLTAAALLEHTTHSREFSLAEVSRLYARGEPSLERLEERGLLVSAAAGYRLFSSMFSPWLLRQITAEAAQEQSYDEWLKQSRRAIEGLAGKQGASLKEILPKVRPNYRELILTWASDPRTFTAVANLLRTALTVAGVG